MKTYGIKCTNGGWLCGGDGLIFWTVSYACACEFAVQIGMKTTDVQAFD